MYYSIQSNIVTGTVSSNSFQVRISYHMRKYHQYLKRKYQLLELISVDEMLDCSSSQYVSLTLLKVEGQGRTTLTEDRSGDNITLSEALNLEGVKKRKIILIEGDPGMGKSTLAINICKCWAEGSLLQTYNAVILLTLRDPEIQAAKKISDLLLTADEELKENVLKDIMSNFGENICFIFEGYDELPQQLCRSSVFTKLREQLPNCTMMYTSRPEACEALKSVACRIIKIDGFRKESVDKYVSNAFEKIKDGKELASQLKLQLQRNPVVSKILHIPINVAIVCLIFYYFLMLPETLTELYTLLCLRLILRHITTRTTNKFQVKKLKSFNDLPQDVYKQFSQLCSVAYKGLGSGQLIFTSQYLSDIGIAEREISDLGLLVTAPNTSVYGREKSYNFLHLTLQEFCAAFYISKFSLEDQVKCITKFCYDDTFLMVWRFYAGITKLKNRDALNQILPNKLMNSDLNEKRTVNLMHCVYEAQNIEACQIVGDHLDGHIHFSMHGYGVVHAVSYFLAYYKGAVHEIDIPGLEDNEFITLIKSLKERWFLLHENTISKLIFKASVNKMTHRSYSFLVELLGDQYPIAEIHIDHDYYFLLQSRDIDSGSAQLSDIELLSQMFTINNTLSVLDISRTDIGPNGAVHLSNLRNVQLCDLRIAGCRLGPTEADKIGKMLYHNKSITSVDLSDNWIGDFEIESLVKYLSISNQLQHLAVCNNGITADGAQHLSRLIKTDHPALTSIELSGNPLGDEGVQVVLSSLLITMEHIGLKGVQMTSASCLIIADALSKVKSISFNPPDDCEEIGDSLAAATTLCDLELQYVSDSANHKLISALKQNDKLKKLRMVYYGTSKWVNDVSHLLKYTKTLTELTITIAIFRQSQQDIIQVADALKSNCSIKTMRYYDREMDQAIALNFLGQLMQSLTIEKLILGVSVGTYYDNRFSQHVEKFIQQINYARNRVGVFRLFHVGIDIYYYKY